MRYYASLIADELKRLLNTVSFASELKTVSKGNLWSYPIPDDVNDWLDAITVEVGNFKSTLGAPNRSLSVTYNLTISYIRRHIDAEVVETTDLERVQTICELLIDNINLNGAGSVLSSYINGPGANLSVETCLPVNVLIDNQSRLVWENNELRASLILIEVEVVTEVLRG